MKVILLVEDTPSLANEMADLLKMQSYNVIIVRTGLEALEKLQTQKPDLIITDLLMPQMDGFELMEQIRNDDAIKDTPVLMITAKSGEEIETKAHQLGIRQVLRKPCRASSLINSVQQLLEGHE